MSSTIKENHLSDSTTIPIGWLIAAVGATLTAFLVVSGTIIWATRLEARGDFQTSQINKIELRQEEYNRDQKAVKESLIEIKVILDHKK